MRWLALFAVLFAPATAQAAWSAPEQLVDGDDASLQALAPMRDGTIRTVIADARQKIGLGFRDATADGPFGPPRVVMPAGGNAFDTRLAADGSGVTLVADGRRRTRVVSFDGAGRLSEPLVIHSAYDAALALSPAGAAAVVWLHAAGADTEVLAAFRDAGSSAFGAPIRAGYALDRRSLVDAGIGDSGEAVITWQVNQFPSALAAAVRLPGAGFSRPRLLSREVSLTSLAVGPGGQAIEATSDGRRLRVSVKRPGQAQMPVLRTIDRAGNGGDTAVAAAGAHRLGLTWTAGPAARVYLGTAERGLRRTATLGHGLSSVRLGIDDTGRALVAWENTEPRRRGDPTYRSRLALAYKPAGGGFGPPVRLGPVALDSTPLALALAPGGRAIAAYESFEPAEADPRGRGYRRVYVTRLAP